MGQIPTTLGQVALLVLCVLPGTTYQFLREAWRGPRPKDVDLGQRMLRAIVASVVLDAAYVVAAGPQLLRLVRGSRPWQGFFEHPRLVGFVALVLLVGVPAAAAGAVSWWQRRRLHAMYRSVPTAWDFAFRDRRPCFVRVHRKEGGWAGGWYGTRSYASSFPHGGELFLESAWYLAADGRFERRIEDTAGLLVRADDVDVVEFLDRPPADTATARAAEEGAAT